MQEKIRIKDIYQPIENELRSVEEVLAENLSETRNKSVLQVSRFLLDSPGKRLRPALVILCAKAASPKQGASAKEQLVKIACGLELIHMASLIHDDVIDHSLLRHHQPTINSRWGEDTSIALGDYLYSLAFKLISGCNNPDILDCISSATKNMCEGELIQVIERDNLSLLKERYLLIVKKKTASLFAASCEAGALLTDCQAGFQDSLKGYGLNFGIAFQLLDDCLDLIGEQKCLGKSPGADFKMGELTLPVLNLLTKSKDKERIIRLLKQEPKAKAFQEIRRQFIHSPAFSKTINDTQSYIQKAKKCLNRLEDSCFKQSLFTLADFIAERIR